MYGVALPPGANTAERAGAAGLVDAVLEAAEVEAWVAQALAGLAEDPAGAGVVPTTVPAASRRGWEQVTHSRTVARPSGQELMALILGPCTQLRGRDRTVAAALGRIAGRRAVVAAVAAQRAGRVTPAGFELLVRACTLAGRLDCALVTLVDTVGADPLPASEDAGLAAAIAAAMTAVLECTAPTVAVVHGEGGSGGALAAATCDVVGVTDTGWFAALGPEGAAAALRSTPPDAAEVMRVAPGELIDDGFADAMAPDGAALAPWLAAVVGRLRDEDASTRLDRRRARWSQPLQGRRPPLFG
jgi:acetyl-CoA carboxylase alpha subunit